MRILVTGATGQLGKEIESQLKEGNHEIKATNSKTLNICDYESVRRVFNDFVPEIVVNCASYTAVDDCEIEENYRTAYAVNVEAVKNLAIECEKNNSKFIHFSTDYVFDGNQREPIIEEHERNPINKYGLTKMLSEDKTVKYCKQYYIIRTSWLYGDGNNFVRTMLKLAGTNKEISVVGDQVGTPTSTRDLTKVVMTLMNTDAFGIYHATNHGECSWYEFAKEIFRLKNIDICVNKVSSHEYIRRARRPSYSVLDNANLRKLGIDDLFQPWEIALRKFLIEDCLKTDFM